MAVCPCNHISLPRTAHCPFRHTHGKSNTDWSVCTVCFRALPVLTPHVYTPIWLSGSYSFDSFHFLSDSLFSLKLQLDMIFIRSYVQILLFFFLIWFPCVFRKRKCMKLMLYCLFAYSAFQTAFFFPTATVRGLYTARPPSVFLLLHLLSCQARSYVSIQIRPRNRPEGTPSFLSSY